MFNIEIPISHNNFIDNKSGYIFNNFLLKTIELKENNEKDIKLVAPTSIISPQKKNFFQQFFSWKTDSKQEIIQLKEKILSKSYNEKITELIKQDLLNEYDSEVIEAVLNEIKIESKNIIVPLENFEKKISINDTSIGTFKATSEKLPIGRYVQQTFNELIKNNLIGRNEIHRLQRPDYSRETFHIQFPFLVKNNSPYYERERYWVRPYKINGETFFVCSQWYEVPANNDRPYYEDWLKKINNKLL